VNFLKYMNKFPYLLSSFIQVLCQHKLIVTFKLTANTIWEFILKSIELYGLQEVSLKIIVRMIFLLFHEKVYCVSFLKY